MTVATPAANRVNRRMGRRALVSQTRVPEIDRDSGSQQVDFYIRWLLDAGWSVTFLASESDGEQHHARRLRQLGVPTFVGYDEAEELLAVHAFDLALLAFWKPASRLLPLIRAASAETRVIVDSVDLHFLRDARRLLGAGTELDEGFGARLAAELNTYASADAVLAVSEQEAERLAGFLGAERVYHLPVAKGLARSESTFEERRGMFFVGNFRHLPNGEAVEYLCRHILPRLDPVLREAHPLTVAGSRLDQKVGVHARGVRSVRMIGWVPSIEPYLERTRVCVVPLLHGAGVKGKIIESLLAGTPVVTTSVGAEGLDLRDGEHALIADDPDAFAAALEALLTDGSRWQRLVAAGHKLISLRHTPERVRDRFLEIVDGVLAHPTRAGSAETTTASRQRRELAYRETVAEFGRLLRAVTEPDSSILVVSRGDDDLLTADGRSAQHFPQTSDGKWAGYHPGDSQAALADLQALREGGARYFAVPSSSFWWLNHYRELFGYLDRHFRRIHSSYRGVVFDLGDAKTRSGAAAGTRQKVLVVGSYDPEHPDPPQRLVEELGRSERFSVAQQWQPASADGQTAADPQRSVGSADWTLYISAEADLPDRFIDRFLGTASHLSRLGVERVQPAHGGEPEMGPPITQRHRGIVAREIAAASPIPVLAVRSGAAAEGPVALVDTVPVGLRSPIQAGVDPLTYSVVDDLFVGDARAVERSHWSQSPRLSVLIATHDRPELLEMCLEGFCQQTLPVSEFEVVVVDDGSPGPRTEAVLRRFAATLPLTWARIEHSGRGTAKNLAVMLARGEVVLFFDDDDVPSPEMLAEHLRAHDLNPDERVAILGYTSWAPQLTVSPLMHYLTDVDQMLFAYGHIDDGRRLDWRCFWEGRVSSKRALHLRHGLHDQRLAYSIDVEMAWRLARHGLEVLYEPSAISYMARPLTFEEFCRRREAKGRAQAAISRSHDASDLRRYLQVDGASERWEQAQPQLDALRERISALERELGEDADGSTGDPRLEELHRCYRVAFEAYTAKGIAEELDPSRPAGEVDRGDNGRRSAVVLTGSPQAPEDNGDSPPVLSVTMPVWSRTADLARMATHAIERVWDVARVPTEVVVIDNGSPHEHPDLRARVFRFDDNKGVAMAWNKGISLARAPVIAVLNSDCWVEPGWDEALYEAVTTGRRIAFPYTDHCDGRGFRQPDQAGTAGWCFMLTRSLIDEVGPFDERFSPAYVEDTDYWHRAWELGIELAPVPAARVTHARRTSADRRSEWLLTGHRYLYGWKHDVEPMRAPPYYHREIIEYQCRQIPTR